MPESIEREMRGLQRASKRLELATTEWQEASRVYATALNQLNRKTFLMQGDGEAGAGEEPVDCPASSNYSPAS
jgi:hypothetical protein